jgi:hypothetical protein
MKFKEKLSLLFSIDEKDLTKKSRVVLVTISAVMIAMLYLLATYRLSKTEFVDDILKLFTLLIIAPLILSFGAILIAEIEGKKKN